MCYDDSRLGSPKQINGLSQFHCITLRLNQAALLQFLWDSSGTLESSRWQAPPLLLVWVFPPIICKTINLVLLVRDDTALDEARFVALE